MTDSNGLLFALVLDGNGNARELDWSGIESWEPAQGVLWVHLDHKGAEARHWLSEKSGIDAVMAESLLQDEVRPRILSSDEKLLLVLRGVNLSADADPEDLVGVRVWIEPNRVITLRHHRLMAVNDVRESLAMGKGPRDVGGCLVALTRRLTDRLGPVAERIEDDADDLEDRVITDLSAEYREWLGKVRRNAIRLRRYVAPQREVLSRLHRIESRWLDEPQKAQLRETADRTIRYLEDIDATRERAAVIEDELQGRIADRMNRTIYLLTVVAAVLLPPSLLTGIFGINLGGMPGTGSESAFTVAVLAIAILGVAEVLLLRHLKWI